MASRTKYNVFLNIARNFTSFLLDGTAMTLTARVFNARFARDGVFGFHLSDVRTAFC